MAINKINRVVLNEEVLNDLDSKATKQELVDAKNELINSMNEVYQGTSWRSPVPTFGDLKLNYPNAKDGWKAVVMDTKFTYQYDLKTDEWFVTSINALPIVTVGVDGLMSKEDKAKVNTVEIGAQKNLSPEQVLEQVKTVDGQSSGLDADLFHGRLPDAFADKVHDHGEYYTKTESNTLLNGKAQKVHGHIKGDITDFAHTHPTSEVTGFGESVKSTILSGLSTATSVAITISDNVITAFGKLQAQITNLLGNLNAHKADSANPHATTKAQVGLGNVDNTSDISKPVSTATSTELNKKVDKVAGKGLSDENYTLIEKNKLGGISNGSNKVEKSLANGNIKIDGVESNVYTHPTGTNPHSTTKADVGLGSVDNIKQATKTEFDSHNTDGVRHITGTERTNWNDANSRKHDHANKTVVDGIAGTDISKWDTVSNKVDKVTGKDLSDQNYTLTEKNKLSGIETGANKYVHPANHPADIVVESTTKRFVSDAEKASWSAKQNALGFTPENPINKGKSGGYAELDTNAKIPLSQLPDIAKQQTYVVTNASERDLLKGLIVGEKCYLTSTGDSYIWNGISWLTLSKADWENVNLQWSNIVGKPASTIANIDDAVSKRHVHANKAIIDGISQTNINTWSGKAEVSQIPTKNSQLINDSNYVTSAELGNAGYGDMTKMVYDKNNNGKVDVAELAESVGWADVTGKPSTFNPVAHTHTIASISNLQAELNLKADKTQVLTNVPLGAKFTDTITTINGETGVINKADIVALGIPAQDTVVDISGKADKSYVDSKVKTDVPLNAEFTDTIYEHPTTHPASMITGLPTSLPANGGKSTYTRHLEIEDTRAVIETPADILAKRIKSMSFDFKSRAAVGNPPVSISGNSSYIYVLTIVGWSDKSGGYPVQVAYGEKNMGIRSGIDDTTWSEWRIFSDDESVSAFHKGTEPTSNTNKLWLDTSK